MVNITKYCRVAKCMVRSIVESGWLPHSSGTLYSGVKLLHCIVHGTKYCIVHGMKHCIVHGTKYCTVHGTSGVGYLIASHFIDMRRRLDKEGKVRPVIVHRLMSFVVSTIIIYESSSSSS